MHRRFAVLVVILGLVGACGGGATPSPAPTSAPTPAPTDIYVPTEEPAPTEIPVATDEPADTPVAGTEYTIKKGDTMYQIALDLGISLADLKAANPDVDPYHLQVGTVLIIPGQ